MQPDDALVTLVGLGPPVFPHDLAEPVTQVLRDRPVHRRDRHALVGLLNELHYLLAGIVTGLGVDTGSPVGACRCEHECSPLPPAVFPLINRSFAVGPLLSVTPCT